MSFAETWFKVGLKGVPLGRISICGTPENLDQMGVEVFVLKCFWENQKAADSLDLPSSASLQTRGLQSSTGVCPRCVSFALQGIGCCAMCLVYCEAPNNKMCRESQK